MWELRRLFETRIVIENEEKRFYFNLFKLTGYIFLLITIIDYFFILYPLNLGNPVWEFQVLEKLIESGWTPILAGLFLFYPKESSYPMIEQKILSWLSRGFLILGILYFLSIPLILGDGKRINNDRNVNLDKQIDQQTQQYNKIEEIIKNANSEQIKQLIAQNPNLKFDINQPEETLKKQFIYANEQTLKAFINQLKKEVKKQNSLTKRTAIKLTIKTILVGILLIGIFNYSHWLRIVIY